MKLTRRRALQLAAVATTTSALLLSTFTPAQAALQVWPSGVRPNCDIVLASPGPPPSNAAWQYYDITKPVITGLVATKVIKVGNSPTPVTKMVTVYGRDSCSGIGTYQVVIARDGVVISAPGFVQSSGSYLNGSGNYASAFGSSGIGKYTYPSVVAYDRFATFVLSGDYKTLLASAPQTSNPQLVATTDAYRNAATYVMRDVRTTVAANKTSIKKGTKVYVGGKFTRATGSSYVNLSGATIVLQRRDKGSSKWVNVASAKTNSSGNVSIGSAPSKTADFRLSYSGIYKSPFYAPAITGTKRVNVT